MTILSAKQVRRAYGNREVLRGVDLSIDEGMRVGFVGRNGSGKSTLAKILAGVESADDGEVIRRQGLRVAYLAQEPQFESATPLDAALEGLAQWREAIAAHTEASEALASLGEADPETLEALIEKQSKAGARVEALGGWDKRHEAEAMLAQVGISDPSASLATMSGGERRRVALARVLVAAPELAILDEPTNHLDLQTVAWLERYLAERFRGALILVTHDRYLLDRVVSHTVEMHDGEATLYQGGWGDYLEAKAQREAHADRVEANRRNFLRSELEWLRRNPKARTTKSKVRVARAEQALEAKAPRKARDARIEVEGARAGRTVLEAEGLDVSVGDRTLVRGLDLRLQAGDRVGIIGPNGCGKTTLLRTLTREREPAAGRVSHGKNTRIAFLDQTRAGLDDTKSIFDNVVADGASIELAGQELSPAVYLERFLFSRHEQRKQVGLLSGGERARVALAKTLRSASNLVILDEPTNDLDVDTLAALEQALNSFKGCVLVVTHDRWFLDRIATSLLVFDGDQVIHEAGNFADLVDRGRGDLVFGASNPTAVAAATPDPESAPAPKAQTKAQTKTKTKLTYAERIELDGLLERVEVADEKVKAIEAEVTAPAFFELPHEQQQARFEALEQAREEAEHLALRWAELEEKAEG